MFNPKSPKNMEKHYLLSVNAMGVFMQKYPVCGDRHRPEKSWGTRTVPTFHPYRPLSLVERAFSAKGSAYGQSPQ